MKTHAAKTSSSKFKVWHPIKQAVATAPTSRWGWVPVLSLVCSLGILLIAFADNGSLRGVSWAESLFWLGLLMILLPPAVRVISVESSEEERIALVILIGLVLYLVKVMHSPFAFTFADEFSHLYNSNEIITSHALFNSNFGLPVSALFPGLEILTVGLVSLSGMSVFSAGIVVIGVARLLFILGLYLFAKEVSLSTRVAGITVLLYTGLSNFLFWSVQFSYESLAFPIAVAVIFVITRLTHQEKLDHRPGYTLIALLGICTITITHHVTSYLLTIFLLAWFAVEYFRLHFLFFHIIKLPNLLRARRPLSSQSSFISAQRWSSYLQGENIAYQRDLGNLALFALVASLTWLICVAGITVHYLFPVLGQAVVSVIKMITQEGSGRQLFVSQTGYVAPLWEQVVGIGSVVLSLLGLPFGLYQIYRRHQRNALLFLLGCMAIGYFGVLGFRLTPAGWETGNRASTFLYVGLSTVLSIGIVEFWTPQRVTWIGRLIFAGYLSILFIGGVIAGWPPTLRLSQPYLIDIGGQTIEPEGLSVARVTNSLLGPNNMFLSDVANGSFLLTTGRQFALSGKADFSSVLTEPGLDERQIQSLNERFIRFALVDRRRISHDNMAGYYFNHPSGTSLFDTNLLNPDVYKKFDSRGDVDRILDSGNIVVYDLSILTQEYYDQ